MDDWKLIRHFKAIEFDSPDKKGSGYSMYMPFVILLDSIREATKVPIKISSGGGYRTESYNRKQVKHPIVNSPHLKGVAADIICTTSENRFKLIKCALEKGIVRIGIGFKRGFIHFDIDISSDKPQNIIWGYNE